MNKTDLSTFAQAFNLAKLGKKNDAYKELLPLISTNKDDINLILTIAHVTPDTNHAKRLVDRAIKITGQSQAVYQAFDYIAEQLLTKKIQPDADTFNQAFELARAGKKTEAYEKLITILGRNKDDVNLILTIAHTAPDLNQAKRLVDRAIKITGQPKVVNQTFDYIGDQVLNPNASGSLANPNFSNFVIPGNISRSVPVTNNVPNRSHITRNVPNQSTQNGWYVVAGVGLILLISGILLPAVSITNGSRTFTMNSLGQVNDGTQAPGIKDGVYQLIISAIILLLIIAGFISKSLSKGYSIGITILSALNLIILYFDTVAFFDPVKGYSSNHLLQVSVGEGTIISFIGAGITAVAGGVLFITNKYK